MTAPFAFERNAFVFKATVSARELKVFALQASVFGLKQNGPASKANVFGGDAVVFAFNPDARACANGSAGASEWGGPATAMAL